MIVYISKQRIKLLLKKKLLQQEVVSTYTQRAWRGRKKFRPAVNKKNPSIDIFMIYVDVHVKWPSY